MIQAYLRPATAAATVMLVLGGLEAEASGFALPEMSIAGLGLANALVANTSDAGALPYNPAVMSFLGDASLGGGVMLINPNNKVSDTWLDPGAKYSGKTPDWIVTGMAHGHMSVNDNLALGLSVNTPFGLETRWPSRAFATGFAAVGAPGGEPTQSKLELISASPSVSYKLNEDAAIAAGLDIYWVRDLQFNTASTRICCGDGTGAGFHLSGLYRRGPWSFGASYYSSSSIDIDDGKVAPPGSELVANTEIDIPWRAQIGVGYQASDSLNMEFDITRTGWSAFDELKVYASDPLVNASLGGRPLVSSANEWRDANAYRLGVNWDLSEATRLRLGYSYDETPQDDDYYSARIPDNDRHLFSVGVRHKLSDGWELEGGYMYVMWKDRSIDQPAPTSGEPNGTALYNGDYESNSHLLGVGLNKRF